MQVLWKKISKKSFPQGLWKEDEGTKKGVEGGEKKQK